MKNRLIVDIYWCALSATWCCKTFTIIHAQSIVVQKFLSELRGMLPHPPHSPLDPPLVGRSLPPEISVQTDPVGAKTPIFNR